MSNVVTILFVILALVIGAAYVAQPEMPVNDCTVKNKDLATMCLSYVPKYYDAGHLTFLGHTKAWAYRWSNKLGVPLSDRQIQSMAKYSSFEDAVNCYFTAAGDASLNMTLSPAEFEARYRVIAPGLPLKN